MMKALSKEDEEAVFKKRLLHDGHGQGEERRLTALVRNISKLYLSEDLNDDITKLTNSTLKELTAAITTAEKYEKMFQMFERSINNIEAAIDEKTQRVEQIKIELKNLELELQIGEKLKKVDSIPDCQITKTRMDEMKRRKENLIEMLQKQRNNSLCLMEACKALNQILEDEKDLIAIVKGDESKDRNCKE